jgi:hypothetical protein
MRKQQVLSWLNKLLQTGKSGESCPHRNFPEWLHLILRRPQTKSANFFGKVNYLTETAAKHAKLAA